MRTRFAPSPTGLLHMGHAYSALFAWDLAQRLGGVALLRIEDIDLPRAKPEFEAQIYEDLAWLGLQWPRPVMRQSERMPAYQKAIATLDAQGLLYRCSCTRKDILAALSAPQEGDSFGPDGPVYPGTCRNRSTTDQRPTALRLDLAKALRHLGSTRLRFENNGQITEFRPEALVDTVGDFVIARKDIGSSYHLCVVVDDAAQEITDVVRGQDMEAATPIHVLLQTLLGLPVPRFHHHRLIRDETGKRLAKRHDALALSALRQSGKSVAEIYQELGFNLPQALG